MTRTTDMSETTESKDATDRSRQSMDEISHANPYTGETAGQLFSRGPIVVADGGEANTVDDTQSSTMKDVSHTPPHGAEGANAVFERGVQRKAADVSEK